MKILALAALVPLAVLAALAASCSRTTTVSNGGSSESAGVTVSGYGEVTSTPDTGFFNVGVEVRAGSVAEARDGAAKAAEKVIASLKANKVDDKDIRTTGLSINPQYDYSKGGEPRITGYIVSNSVEVKVRKLDSFSKVIDDAAAAGGDDVRVNSVRFGLEDDAKAIEEAREEAMTDAKKKAEQLAKAGGVGLGKPLSISEQQSAGGDLLSEKLRQVPATGLASDTSTPIQPGTGKITVNVTVRWALND
jgi:uncharacterized protein YggE